MDSPIDNVIEDVVAERARQVLIWGEQSHSLPVWNTILTEEVGELSKEILGYHFDKGDVENAYKEAIQVAAVAMAIAQSIKHGKA